jgi:predicted nucleotidyltransferase
MRLLEVAADLSQLEQYAQRVIQHGGISEVYLVGSAVHSATPNDIDMLYVFDGIQDQATEEDVTNFIEQRTNIDLDMFDSFFKCGEQYFYAAKGAGRSIIENTKYALHQLHKGKIKLA